MALKFADVTFCYRRSRPVLSDFSFEFPSGSTVVLGPNGAGKSTLLALAASALRGNDGQVWLGALAADHRSDRVAYRRAVGWLPQQVQVVSGLTAREQVAYAGWLKGMSRAAAWDGAIGALARVRLGDIANDRADRLSGGQLRRIGVAQTLVHGARLMLMDEPTAGLDPAQRRGFRELVVELSADTDLIASTHQTEDLVVTYENVVVLAKGRVRWSGTVTDFLALASNEPNVTQRAERAYSSVLGDDAY